MKKQKEGTRTAPKSSATNGKKSSMMNPFLKLQMQSRLKEKGNRLKWSANSSLGHGGGTQQLGSQAFVPVLGRKRGLGMRQDSETRPLRKEGSKMGKSTLKCREDSKQQVGNK